MISPASWFAWKITTCVGLPLAAGLSATHHFVVADSHLPYVLAVPCLLLLAYLATRAVVRPLAEVSAAATRIAQGDLSVPLNVHGRDVVGSLGCAVSSMRRSLVDCERALLANARRAELVQLESACVAEARRVQALPESDLSSTLRAVAHVLAVESLVLLGQPLHVRIQWPAGEVASRGFVGSSEPVRAASANGGGAELMLEIHPVVPYDLRTRDVASPVCLKTLARQVAVSLADVLPRAD